MVRPTGARSDSDRAGSDTAWADSDTTRADSVSDRAGSVTDPAPVSPARPRRGVTLLVAAEILAAALLLAAGTGPAVLALAALGCAAALLVAYVRVGGHRGYRWLGLAPAYLARRRSLPAGGDLLGLLRPGATVHRLDLDGTAVGAVVDAYGSTAIIELGDPDALLAPAHGELPSPADLLPPVAEPAVRVQLLLYTVPAPAPSAGTTAATSYRQLTQGRVPALQRAFLAVHVEHPAPLAALRTALRRTRRRVERAGLPSRPVPPEAVRRILAELAHRDPVGPLREHWSGLATAAGRQVTFRLAGTLAGGDAAPDALDRLLALPGCAVTLSVSAQRPAAAPHAVGVAQVDIAVRLAAPDPTALAGAAAELPRALGPSRGPGRGDARTVARLDGRHLAGLAATLPLGGRVDPDAATIARLVRTARPPAAADAVRLARLASAGPVRLPRLAAARLVLGVDRRGEPVTVRLVRPQPTRVVLVGGVSRAQLLVLRALAVGVRVVVHSARPEAWAAFARATGAGGALLNPAGGDVDPGPASAVHPRLTVVDPGPPGGSEAPTPSPWGVTLAVRDRLTVADADSLGGADLVLLPRLSATEVTVAASALGLGPAADWLARIPADMVGVLAGAGPLRWALLCVTEAEEALVGGLG